MKYKKRGENENISWKRGKLMKKIRINKKHKELKC